MKPEPGGGRVEGAAGIAVRSRWSSAPREPGVNSSTRLLAPCSDTLPTRTSAQDTPLPSQSARSNTSPVPTMTITGGFSRALSSALITGAAKLPLFLACGGISIPGCHSSGSQRRDVPSRRTLLTESTDSSAIKSATVLAVCAQKGAALSLASAMRTIMRFGSTVSDDIATVVDQLKRCVRYLLHNWNRTDPTAIPLGHRQGRPWSLGFG